MKMKPISRAGALLSSMFILGPTCFTARGQATITQSEPDDSIGTANPTGFVAGTSGIKRAFGNTGDGLYGLPPGDGTGDVDFYKISVAAGQVIYANISNAGIDPDFDSYLGLYDSAGGLLIESDDEGDTPRGYDRTSKFVYTVTTAGDYYICVSNWIAATSLPSDPFTPGTAPGLPGGKAGPYQVFIGLDVAVPVPEFVGGSTGYPVPAFLPVKALGTPRYDGVLTLHNSSTGTGPSSNYVITGFSLSGANASRFAVTGFTPPVTIAPGAEVNIPISFNSGGAGGLSTATLNLTSNDPFTQSFKLDTYGSPVVGGGTFAAKQVSAASGTTVNSMDIADQLLDGTLTGTTYNSNVAASNFGTGGDGHLGSDLNFPIGAAAGDNFALQVAGTFFIRTAGIYTFLGYSDDGQRLVIDGNELYSVTDYNKDHFGSLELTAGPHTLQYTMYEGGGGNSAELLISKQPGEFTKYIDSTWELLEAYSADADGDGMPNDYELANGTNPDVADGGLDLDSDGSTNYDEYVKGTKPKVPDTDGDGLQDGVETKTGIWVSTSNTGTDPLVSDSDKDGLLDGVENPGLASTGPAQPGSDPNKKDTDGDGYADLSEVTIGTDPKLLSSVPSFIFQPVISDNFDSPGFHSTYNITALNQAASFIPGVYGSDSPPHGQVVRLTDNLQSSHNSLSWDYVDTISAPAVQISFDFRIGAVNTDPADGLGIGLFRKSAYGTAGNSTAINGSKSWENPTGGGGFGDALFFGFGVYGTDTIRLTGPLAPAVPVASFNPSFNLAPVVDPINPYNRAVITVITNGASSSMVKLKIIQDVDGAATERVIFDNVLVPGFAIASEDFRLIAGARTGASFSQVEIDNVTFSVPAQTTPSLLLSNTPASFLADIYDGTAKAVNPASMQVTLNGAPVPVSTSKTGGLTTVSYPGTPSIFFPAGTNTVVFNYTSTDGTPYTETRTFAAGDFKVIPNSLVVAPSAAGIPGFNVRTVQVSPNSGTTANRLDYMEGLLNGDISGSPFNGGNVADPTGAVDGLYHADTINFEQSAGKFGFFDGESLIPGIPGTTGSTDNFVFEALSWVNFPAAGIYQFGVVADDGFRVSYTHAPVPALSIVTPAASSRVIAAVPSIASTAAGGLAGPYPASPVTTRVVASDPANGSSPFVNAADMVGNIALIDRGVVSFAIKLQNAQAAGAVGAIIINQTFPNDLPFVMGGTAADVTIPGVMISKYDGDALKALLAAPGGLTVKFGPDTSTTLGSADLNQTTTFQVAVGTPGLYPVRFLNFEGGGGASAEWYSIDSSGVKHLVNNPDDESALKAYSTISTGTAPSISISQSGGSVTINYTGVLQSSATLGSFTDVSGATSPYTVPVGSPGRLFFRARP